VAAVRYHYLVRDVDRHGNIRWYVRRHNRKARLHAEPGTEAFLAAYRAALEALNTAADARSPSTSADAETTNTWRHLCKAYCRSTEFLDLEANTRRSRMGHLQSTWGEPVRPGAVETYADFPAHRLTPLALAVLRDRKRHLPAAANNRVKSIRAVCRWAAEQNRPCCDQTRQLASPN
jgi:hypothetical protein